MLQLLGAVEVEGKVVTEVCLGILGRKVTGYRMGGVEL